MLAALGSHTDCVHILLEKGAKSDAADTKGFTALHRAVGVLSGTKNCGSAVIFCPNMKPALLLKAMLGCEGCVSALLEHGASALYRDSQGRTPLHLAASLGHTALLRTLLKAALKSDPLDSILDYRGYMPVHWAAYHGEILLPEFLCKYRHGTILGCLVRCIKFTIYHLFPV